ncbi:MAG TPA: sugar phosphate isomerase/epimerase [Candidatus Latescibacteria bacterium]|jgi:sugar phosphate isomerase/epimerase|nr:xylose isomerase [Gemmatimonadaceae bacterium]MDP6015209.1 sugar phosphate isomerase/epimerase [Candidatus Latescibacterota bacterium]HJP28937.1 sugar phosphate isomerase/epimerase [Candidatus Latescibacterota bacterium]
MKLSLSTRVAESFRDKREATVELEDLAEIAAREGYYALCMRASQVGVDDSRERSRAVLAILESNDLSVSMVTGDFAIPENSEEGPGALRNIEPYLDLADDLGCDLLRVCMKTADDIRWARDAADEAQERGLRLAHQSHTLSLFETVEETLEVLRSVGRSNFGLIYEPANLELCGQPYAGATLEALVPWIFNVYLQNQRLHAGGADRLNTWCRGAVQFDQCPLWEEGGIEVARIIEELDRLAYKGYVTVHQASAGLGGAEEAARRSAKFLSDIGPFEDRKAPR